jgi:RNA polymerase sigma factor (sigma-70 family)
LFLFRKNKSEEDDLSLIARYRKQGDKDCIGVLFERYTYLVYGICMKYFKDEEQSKDAVMDVFEKVMHEIERHQITNFSSWLHSVARNYCLMQLRSQKTEEQKSEDWKKNESLFVEITEELHPNNTSEKEKLLQSMEQAIQELNPEQKTCIQLFYIEQKSYQQVADITGYELKQVKSYIQNGKRNIENIMRKYNGR